MTTVKHLEKLWKSKLYGKIGRELLFGRPEQSLRIEAECHGPAAAAALILIRLDELNQSHTPLAGTVLRAILSGQENDGGWGDPTTTAFCVRALLSSRGDGQSLDRALRHLADLQKSEGIWPKVPIRRMPADAFVSAFVLFQLVRDDRFRAAVRLPEAVAWFESNASSIDPEAGRLWGHVEAIVSRHPRLARRAHADHWS